MRNPRIVVVLAYAALIAACTATADAPNLQAPPSPSAPAAPTTLAVPAAPAVTSLATESLATAATTAPAPKNLKSAMKGIEDDFKLIEKALEPGATADLKSVAAAAERVAAVMKLAYDPWEDKEVPNFGKFAHEAEDAFRAFAAKAAAGDAAGVQQLGKTLQPQQCARCHDAVEQVHG